MGSWLSKNNHESHPAPSLPAAITTTSSTSSNTTAVVMITKDKSIFDNPTFLYILVPCISAVLLTMLVITTICFIRKRKDHNTPRKTSQEQDPADTVHQAPAENTQVKVGTVSLVCLMMCLQIPCKKCYIIINVNLGLKKGSLFI
ncbi:uncharacterized protein RBU57_005374 isoform 1-T1 [Macrochelys suwanniensis]